MLSINGHAVLHWDVPGPASGRLGETTNTNGLGWPSSGQLAPVWRLARLMLSRPDWAGGTRHAGQARPLRSRADRAATSRPDRGPRAEVAKTRRHGTRGDYELETEAITNLKLDRRRRGKLRHGQVLETEAIANLKLDLRGKLRRGKVRRPLSSLGCAWDTTACCRGSAATAWPTARVGPDPVAGGPTPSATTTRCRRREGVLRVDRGWGRARRWRRDAQICNKGVVLSRPTAIRSGAPRRARTWFVLYCISAGQNMPPCSKLK